MSVMLKVTLTFDGEVVKMDRLIDGELDNAGEVGAMLTWYTLITLIHSNIEALGEPTQEFYDEFQRSVKIVEQSANQPIKIDFGFDGDNGLRH